MPGAKRAEHPAFVAPCLATLRSAVPTGEQWIHEVKFDGYRAQAHLAGGKPIIYSRRGYDWTTRFGNIARALPSLPATDLVLDGEVVVLDADGHSDFHELQNQLASGRTDRLTYCVFDLLYLDGYDLRPAALYERKLALRELLRTASGNPIEFSDHFEADGPQVFEQACAMRLEGIVSKQRDAPYRSGRQENWLKIKCKKSGTYPIIAFVEKLGAEPRRIASLYVGRREGDRLLYAGKAGTGYTEASARQLREQLDPYVRPASPLSVSVNKPKATWLEPVVEAEIEYGTITADGLLREAVFKGLRDDLQGPTHRAPQRARSRGGVPKENILQLLPDAVVPSKDELTAYWRRVHERALKYLARRPLKLVRHTRGTTFYHMGPLPPIPPAVHQLKIVKRKGGEGVRLWVDDLAGLLGLVEIGAVELHPWNSTVDDLEHPDTLVFDLDPGEGIPWSFVVDAAAALRGLLRKEGLTSWPKLSGGKGIHVMAPIERRMTHDAAHQYSQKLAQQLARTDARRYTISAAPSDRKGRLFIDYLRNGRGTTAAGAYSPRARPGLPIAAPVSWKLVESGVRADAFTLASPF